MKLIARFLLIAGGAAILAGCAQDERPAMPADTERSQALTPAAKEQKRQSAAALKFQTAKGINGQITAQLSGAPAGNYNMLSSGDAVELQGKLFHMAQIYREGEQATDALLSYDPGKNVVSVLWSDTLTDTDNLWYNAFISNLRLIKLDEERLLFLESEMAEGGGRFHLSAYHAITQKVERIREDFWPLTDQYDVMYQMHWNPDKQQLFLQSFLGNVWFVDFETGKDQVHLQKFRVIPHSTTGAPSLFLSPAFNRFVHDDESGQLTFYSEDGMPLQKVRLPQQKYVPSEKIKWNPTGTVAWMESADEDQSRVKGIDIDFLSIAPQRIDFFDPDGRSIGSIQAEGGRHKAVEVAGWSDDKVAIMKEYSVARNATGDREFVEKKVSYFLYEVPTAKKSAAPAALDLTKFQSGQGENAGGSHAFPVKVEKNIIIYPSL